MDRQHPAHYRAEEMQELKRAIRRRENRLILGVPGVGVSNLLRFLVTRTDWDNRRVTFAYLICDALDDCLDHQKFFSEIARQFYEQGLGAEPDRNLPGYEQLKRLLQQVEVDPADRLVITVDKVDRMLATADEAFYRRLEVLTDLNKRVCCIFGAGLALADSLISEPLLFAGHKLKVGRFNERDFAGAVLEEAQRLEVEFDSEAQARLARLTGRHPGLLRTISSVVTARELDLSLSEAELVERLLAREDVQSRCRRIWQALDPTQQAALQAIVVGQPALVVPKTLAWLRDLGLVDEGEGTYRLFSPIFEGFVVAQATSARPILPEAPLECVKISKPTLIFRNEQEIIVAGAVFKGSEEVHVAPLELRLIACLKREAKIYTKEEIANYVYYEEEGIVEDSRLENLVRQVRKRLGDPRCIKTHWGQGYEFVDSC
jgi:hypothetical protein